MLGFASIHDVWVPAGGGVDNAMVTNTANSLVQTGRDSHSKWAISPASGKQNRGISHEPTDVLPPGPLFTEPQQRELFSRIVRRLVETGEISPSQGVQADADSEAARTRYTYKR